MHKADTYIGIRSIKMADFLVILVIAVIVGASLLYIRKEKKRGVQCIGCPAAGNCAKHKQGGCGSGAQNR